MSHLAKVSKLIIKRTDVLEQAVNSLGWKIKNTNECRYWGGTQKVDLVIDCGLKWDIGLRKTREGYEIWADTYGSTGEKIKKAVQKLQQAYAIELVKTVAAEEGYWLVSEQTNEDGSIELTVEVQEGWL